MTLGDPWGHDGKTYDGKEMRQLVDSMFVQTGVVGLNDYLVEQQSSPNATVKVRAGEIIITATGSGLFGKYEVPNDASINSGSFTATSTNGRKDRLILRVTSGVAALEIVQGTASASPAEPSITGDNYEELALITMPGSTTNITTAMITDRRKYAAGPAGMAVCSSTTHPASPFEGMAIYETDTDKRFVYDGSNFIEIGVLSGWNTYTPTIGAASGSPIIGNGVSSGRYFRDGKFCHVEAGVQLGSTTNFGTGIVTLSLPFTMRTPTLRIINAAGEAYDASLTTPFAVSPVMVTPYNKVAFSIAGSSAAVSGSGSTPFGWATGDSLSFSGDFEIA